MIPRTYSVLAPFTGSDQSLSRSLSPVDRLPPESSPRHPSAPVIFDPGSPLIHLPTCQFSRRIPHRKPQKAIQYIGRVWSRSNFRARRFRIAAVQRSASNTIVFPRWFNYAGPFLVPLTIRTSAGKLIPRSVEYPRRASST